MFWRFIPRRQALTGPLERGGEGGLARTALRACGQMYLLPDSQAECRALQLEGLPFHVLGSHQRYESLPFPGLFFFFFFEVFVVCLHMFYLGGFFGASMRCTNA